MTSLNAGLDRTDKRILRAIQVDCSLGAEALGEACGASPSTVSRRRKRLRDLGVVTAEVAIIDPKKVGRPLMMIVGVRLQQEDARTAESFVAAIRAHPAVTQCYFVTGESDYILHISAADMDEFNAFVQTHLVSNPFVNMTATSVVISPLKVGLAVPIVD
jgi:Lrp/AsnC family leucine-responsive transcriptional regulator